ncbi:hypothetical protein [Streptomyces sp. NBC_00454]
MAPSRAAEILGNGLQIRASDTVPFALWSPAPASWHTRREPLPPWLPTT